MCDMRVKASSRVSRWVNNESPSPSWDDKWQQVQSTVVNKTYPQLVIRKTINTNKESPSMAEMRKKGPNNYSRPYWPARPNCHKWAPPRLRWLSRYRLMRTKACADVIATRIPSSGCLSMYSIFFFFQFYTASTFLVIL